MGPVVFIHIPGFFLPEESDAVTNSSVTELQIRTPGPRELVPLAVSIATGMPHSAHGIDLPRVLDRDPIRLRARRFDDVPFPWLWDIARAAGRSTVVIGWPGFIRAEGSDTPMVCRPAFHGSPSEDGAWPLATPLVSPPDIRDAMAAARIAPDTVDLGAFFDESDLESMDDSESTPDKRSLQRVVASLMSALRMLKHFCSADLDLAVLAPRLSVGARVPSVVRRRLLDLMLDEIRGMMGVETTVVMVCKRGQLSVLRVDTPVTGGPDVTHDQSVGSTIDIAPTILGLVDVPAPAHMDGRNLLDPTSRREPRFELSASAPDSLSDIEQLVDLLDEVEEDALSEKRRAHLVRHAITQLHRLHRSSLARIDYRSALKQARLLARLTPDALSLWHVAFAARKSGDDALVLETTRTLLSEHAGTPQAVLSIFLSPTPPGDEESRVILDSIDPNQLVVPSMRGVWARMAIAHDRVDEGVEILSRLHERRSALPVDRVLLASVLLGRDEADRALSVLGLLGQSPQAPLKAKILRAKALLAVGRHDEARMQANQIIAQVPHHPGAQRILKQLASSDG